MSSSSSSLTVSSRKRRREEDHKSIVQIFLQRLGWVSVAAKRHDIMVIADGAGTTTNKAAYDELDKTYNVKYVRAGSKRSLKYPVKWQYQVDVDTSNPDSLGGFAAEVGESIHDGDFVPSLIVCGSRGGQVVLKALLQTFWRGPFVCLNGAVLTSNTILPAFGFPVLITQGFDNFPTYKTAWTVKQFKELSEEGKKALVVHLPNEHHILSTEALKAVLINCVEAGLNDGDMDIVQDALVWPDYCELILVSHGRAVQYVTV